MRSLIAFVLLFACTPTEPLSEACDPACPAGQVCVNAQCLVAADAGSDAAQDVLGAEVAVDVQSQDVTPAADLEVSIDSLSEDALDASPTPDASGIDATVDTGADVPADGRSDAATCDARCDGACVNTGFDLDNCGACGRVCRPRTAHTLAQCFGGICETPCEVGWGDCDGNAANGCELNLRGNDNANCGGCRADCQITETCMMGVCRSIH